MSIKVRIHCIDQTHGTGPARILATAREIMSGRGKKGQIPPYWDGLSGKRIVAGLSKIYCKE